jgi:hypothetical protein
MSRFMSRRPFFGILVGICGSGIVAMVYMPFLPNNKAVVIGFAFSTLCMATALWHILEAHREAARDRSAALEFARAGALHRPIVSAVVTVSILGIFGFFAATYLLAGLYTRLLGYRGDQTLTVSGGFWRKGCYETSFEERPTMTQVFRALCLGNSFKVGERVVVSGYITWLGTYVERVVPQTRSNTSLERTRER